MQGANYAFCDGHVKWLHGMDANDANPARNGLDYDCDGTPGTTTLRCEALFVFIGADPKADWLPPSAARDKLGYLLTGSDALRSGSWPLKDRDPLPLETTIPGVLAGGDIRAGSTKRVGFAVGDGSLAVTCVHRLRAQLM